MRKLSMMIGAAVLSAAMLTGCGSTGGSAPTSSAEDTNDMTTEKNYKATGDNVKLLGRTYFDEDSEALYCALSGTGAEFTFTGTKCTITVAGDNNSEDTSQADNHARVGIYVNGERVIDDMVDQKEETYEVFSSEEAKDVTVTFVKLSESPMSTIGITGINVTGTAIKPTAEKEKLIEFIGDSITCGYGIDDPNKNHHFSTKTEDVTKAYAYKTAEKLGADYSLVSFSGYGIISGYSDGKKKVPEQALPKYYTKLGYSWAQNGSFKPSDIEWDFTAARQPDVVVINLGTNDDSYTGTHQDRQEEYAAAYTEFIKTVRSKNPNAKIVCVLGVMGDRLFDYVQKAADDYTAQTGDSNISTLKLAVQQGSDGYSADWHPSVKTHEKTAEAVAAHIRTLL